MRKIITLTDQDLALRCRKGRIVLIDDDQEILSAISSLLYLEGYACETFQSAVQYLQTLAYNQPQFPGPSCVLCDVKMPVLDGLELQRRLLDLDNAPLILMSGESGANEAVQAFRAGVLDFLLKPIEADLLLAAIDKALQTSLSRQAAHAQQADWSQRIENLTEREREIARQVTQGKLNREIAEDLGIALRTVKLYRQRAMQKLGIDKLVELTRLADQGLL